MSHHAPGSNPRVVGRVRAALALSLLSLLASGCGQATAPGDPSKAGALNPETGAEPGLSLPPDFKPVDRPLDQRKVIFGEIHLLRAGAMTEANGILPMDNAHMPKDDKPAFDKRMAEHKAILDPILEKGMAAIARKHGLEVADLPRIEEEANRLRWTPPPPSENKEAK